jgi:hypothetical protein
MNIGIIKEDANSQEKIEELEQLLIFLGLKDELFSHFLSRGLNSVEKFINMDSFGINKNILTEQKKILILKNASFIFEKINNQYTSSKTQEEYEEAIEDISIIDMIRNSYYEFEGNPMSKELLIKGFKQNSKPNNYLPKAFQVKNISDENISASVLSSKNINSLNNPIEGFKNLMYLYLNDNKIQMLENLNFNNLIYLDLSNNLLRKISNLESLINLEHLNLEKNCITRLENLQANLNIDYLNLNNQLLSKRQNMVISEDFVSEYNKISIILLEGNNIYDISALKSLKFCQKLTLQENHLYEFNLILETLSHMDYLENLNLMKNPFIESFKNYRDLIILQNKNLIEFDMKTVTDNEKKYIKSLFELKYSKGKKDNNNNNNNNFFSKEKDKEKLNFELNGTKMNIKEDSMDQDYNKVNLLSEIDNPIFRRNKVLSHNKQKNYIKK